MKDIVISTVIILAIAVSAAAVDHLFLSVSAQISAFAAHKGASPAAFLLPGRAGLPAVTWL